MVRFAGDVGTCRRRLIADHFELDATDEPCGACDACARTSDWVAASFTARPAAAKPGAEKVEAQAEEAASDTSEADPDAPFRRGDWVRIDGRHLGHVVRVEGDGKRIKLVVESASDLKRRTVDPRRKRVEKIE